ncbi:AraC-type DNA-binding protein [Chitinophaga sp. YR627]|uniref:AraC family transcriptional regulator n=1 Tax=Chitinophaga sp. YR627 TaxID=1881041 RepID=UPI0008F332BC|nr:helix-turn-helix domain-containing protein [Chitinophaga sp. YR627]SFO00026.1 AraC-type DNA-binding protein [Chitinophaga sp. YR627]
MSHSNSHNNSIIQLADINEMFVSGEFDNEGRDIQVYNRENNSCIKNLKPNRRSFYQIIFFNSGSGLFTLGLNEYKIKQPSIAFVNPHEIISWENTGKESTGHICLFRKSFLDDHPALSFIMNKYRLFNDNSKSVISLPPDDVEQVNELFNKMHKEAALPGPQSGDTLQAYIQLIIVAGTRSGIQPDSTTLSNEFRHVYDFFQLLEHETAGLSYDNPVKLKSAHEFAARLAIHPNYLNALSKKYTGETVSAHIRNRLLEESKILLKRTDWTLEHIAFAIGFTAQPGFSQFFKNNTGITPADYRKKVTTEMYISNG